MDAECEDEGTGSRNSIRDDRSGRWSPVSGGFSNSWTFDPGIPTAAGVPSAQGGAGIGGGSPSGMGNVAPTNSNPTSMDPGEIGAVTGVVTDGLNLVIESYTSAFSMALYGQAYRGSLTSRLTQLSQPLRGTLGRIGVYGMVADTVIGVATFVDSGNPVPLVVSTAGVFLGYAVLTTYGAPAAFAFGVAYGVAGIFGAFDSDSFE